MAVDPSFTIADLTTVAISTCNGALLARDPQHDKNYKMLAVILLAVIAGLSGTIVRDILINVVPVTMTNPWYVIVAVTMACAGLVLFRAIQDKHLTTVTQILSAITIPWLAIVCSQKAFQAHFDLYAALFVGVLCSAVGRLLLDMLCGTTSKVLLRGDWYVGTALFTSLTFLLFRLVGLSFIISTLIANFLGLGCSFLLLYRLQGIRYYRRTRKD